MNIELINYKRKRAKETYRICYAIFYEVVALLLTKELSSAKHSDVRSLFNREFVKIGIVKEKLADFYNKMFDFRQKADYGDFVEFEEEKVRMWLKNTVSLLTS